MRSLPTAVSAATAAALAALAITVTVPAIGDDNTSAKTGAGPGQVDRQPDVESIRACLKNHGASVPDGDGRVLKDWAIGVHTSAEKAALEACGIGTGRAKTAEVAGPDETTLRSCLKDHDVVVPDGDGGVLKRWIVGDRSAAEKQALEACGMKGDAKSTTGPVQGCGEKDPDAGSTPGDPKRSAVTPAG
jgi:hypothetical protein